MTLQLARELRHPQTPAEATLWRAICNRNLAYKFWRQHPIDRFVIDFHCAQAKLCIEIDGASHLDPAPRREPHSWKNLATE
jgi:very-short-patch-repair endonuclease